MICSDLVATFVAVVTSASPLGGTRFLPASLENSLSRGGHKWHPSGRESCDRCDGCDGCDGFVWSALIAPRQFQDMRSQEIQDHLLADRSDLHQPGFAEVARDVVLLRVAHAT